MGLSERDHRRLIGCDATLIAKLDRAFTEVQAEGLSMMVTDGVRTVSQQQAKWFQGRDAAGHIIDEHAVVTYCDGILKKSNHQSGKAADCCFVVNGLPSWDHTLPWQSYGQSLERNGLAWGGRWKKPKMDRPHAELVTL